MFGDKSLDPFQKCGAVSQQKNVYLPHLTSEAYELANNLIQRVPESARSKVTSEGRKN